VLALYADVMEKSKESNHDHWAKEKLDTLKGVQGDMELNPKVKQRKAELEKAKKKNGSIASVVTMVTTAVKTAVTTPVRNDKKRKRVVPATKVKIPNPKDSPEALIGKRIAKFFEKELFFGTVESIVDDDTDETWWHIHYDDDDSEDMGAHQVRAGLRLYDKYSSKDKRSKPRKH
jgi:hypothetical protein